MYCSATLLMILLLAAHVEGFRWLQDYDDELAGGYQRALMTRNRRTERVTACGGKVWKMVMASCGGECTATETNIATRCCESKCTMEEIVESCCKP